MCLSEYNMALQIFKQKSILLSTLGVAIPVDCISLIVILKSVIERK